MKNLARHFWYGGRAEIVRVVVRSDIDSGLGHGGRRGIGCIGLGVKVHLMAVKPALFALIEIRKDRLQRLPRQPDRPRPNTPLGHRRPGLRRGLGSPEDLCGRVSPGKNGAPSLGCNRPDTVQRQSRGARSMTHSQKSRPWQASSCMETGWAGQGRKRWVKRPTLGE